MATIGSLAVRFGADVGPLNSGVDAAIASLGRIGEAVGELQKQLGGLSAAAVSLSVDTSSIDAASKSLDSLRDKASSASTRVAISADASSVSELGEAVEQTGASAVQSRSSLASLAVTSAVVISGARQAAEAYGNFREGMVGFIQTATGARNASAALNAAYRGLRGDVESLRAVFGGVRAGVERMVAAFASAENINNLLVGSLGGVMRLFGATDDAVIRSAQVISSLITEQISLAASHRLVQRSLQVVGSAYDVATNAMAGFLAGTAAGRKVGELLSDGLLVAVRAAIRVDSAIGAAQQRIAGFLTSGRLMGQVAAAVGTAFDAIADGARNLIGTTGGLGSSLAAIQLRVALLAEGLIRMLPSSSQAAAAFTSLASSAARFVPAGLAVANTLANVASGLGVVMSVAGRNAGFLDFTAAVAQTASLSVGFGALTGAASGAIAGTGALAGAATGAGAAVAGLAASFPLVVAGAVAVAVATGKVEQSLRHVADAAETLGNLSDRFGQPVQEIEKLEIAAEQSGVALMSVVRAQQTFSQNMSKVKIGQLGTAQAREAKSAFDRLGISADDMRKANPEEVLTTVAKRLGEIPDAAKRTQVAMDIFGRTGPQILPMLKNLEQLNEDIGRLGGTISNLDFKRFSDLDQSFDRLATAQKAMGDDLAIPFTRMGEAWNNVRAEVIGGLAPLVGAIGEVIADISTPFAVALEIIGRVIGTVARLTAAAVKLVTAFLPMSVVANLAELIGDAFNAIWSLVEGVVDTFEAFATAVEEVVRPSTELLKTLTGIFQNAIGEKFGAIAAALTALAVAFTFSSVATQVWAAVMATSAGTAIASAVATAAAWVAAGAAIVVGVTGAAIVIAGMYIAAVITAAATTIASCAAMHVAWLFGLGPIGLLVAGIELIVVGAMALWAMGSGIVDFFSGFSEGEKAIDGATASVDQLAEAVDERRQPGIVKDMTVIAEAAGYTKEEVAAAIAEMEDKIEELTGVRIDLGGNSIEETRDAIASARDVMGELSIRAAQLGPAAEDAIKATNEQFVQLQRDLADNKISLEQFTEQSSQAADSLAKNLNAIEEGSPEETLKKNLELFKSLDEAAKSSAKSVREIGAGVQIGDKFFPRSEEVKARAKEYSQEYADALDAIKKKQAAGGFQEELTARRQQNQEDFDAGRIDAKTFQRTKRELDTTNAQEQASLAAEEVQRELDRKQAKLKIDLDFADGIRKELESAFLTPVEKFQKELKKIRDNPELTDAEKFSAEQSLTKKARESLVGNNASSQLFERRRDLNDAVGSGLITQQRADFEGKKALDEFAQSLGVVQTPFEEFSTSLDGIAEKFGFVGQPLDEVRKQLEGTPERLALFDRALKESRDKLLASLGIEKSPEQVFQEQMKKIEEAANSSDPNKRITSEQRQQAEEAARRKRDKALGAGDGLGGQFAERQANINEAFGGGKDNARFAIASNALAMDRRAAAGLDADPAQQLKAGAAKIDDAFDVTGKTLAEIQASLSPEEFAAYQEAQKKNVESVKANLGVEKSAAAQLADARGRLEKAVKDNVITEDEKNKAIKEQRDSLLSSLGIQKTPAKDFEDAVAKIKENASELSPDELAKGLKEAKDKLLQALGVDKSPAQAAEESLTRLREAFAKGQIDVDEFAKGAQKAKDSLLQSLGIPLDPVAQLRERLGDLDEAFQKRLITEEEFTRGQEEARRAMLPGGEAESPVKKFERDLDAVNRAVEEGLISGEDGAQRRKVLQAQLQEDMKPALDRLGTDRRAIEASDVRSKGGVDTFFRILRGQDNPSLKAQLETAKATKFLAEAAAKPEAAEVIAQL